MMIVPNDKLAIKRNCCTYTMNNILYKTRISRKSPSAEGTQDTTTWLLVESVEDSLCMYKIGFRVCHWEYYITELTFQFWKSVILKAFTLHLVYCR